MFDAPACQRCRRDFPALERRLEGLSIAFLDGPAGTQVPRAVMAAVDAYYRRSNANSGGVFVTSRETDAMLRRARETVAAFLGAPSWRQVSFGANMTTLTYSLSHALARELVPGDEVVVTQLDHEANRGPWLALECHGAVVREIPITPEGQLDAAGMAAAITPRARIVAVGAASNALGTVNDLRLARRLSREAGAWLVVDAVHHAAHFPLDVQALDPDFLLCSAYKFYGPHVGILYCREGLLDELEPDRLRPQEQAAPERIETGTLNHAAIAGVDAAIRYVASWGEGADLRSRIVSAQRAIAAYEEELVRAYAEAAAGIPGVRVWGPPFTEGELRAPTVAVTLEGVAPADAARELAARGLQVWAGDFYAVRPMEVLGLAERGGVVRAGIVMYNTGAEVERLLEGLRDLAGRR